MNYFCDVHVQSGEKQEKRLFVVLEDEAVSKMETPNLTKEILLADKQYQEFTNQYKPKRVYADYIVYSTEEEILADTQDEVFISLLRNEKVQRIGHSELAVDAKDKLNGKKKRKKSSPIVKIIIVGCILIVGTMGFGMGNMLGKMNAVTVETLSVQEISEDGMLISEQQEIDADTEQITISIDRSYSAVPTEDLQLKGAVVNGVAQITLPEFDKTDFFTHVAGYTWGFSTDPDADKIEYYGGQTYSFTKNIKLYRVLVKYGGGSGTKDDPYLINYYDQLELMSEEKARGYFKQTADIVFPDWASHTSINTVNKLKSSPDNEYFEYDGDGYLIENLDNPLFGKISGAVIKNVNIINSTINTTEYSDLGFIACNVYNYCYEAEDGTTYETGETLIQNCTVSHSAIIAESPESEETQAVVTEVVTAPVVTPPDVIEYDEDGNIIETEEETESESSIDEPTKYGEYAVGAITGIGGQIENCYVTDFGIYANLEDYILYAGGISGKPANVINSAVYNCSISGKIFNAGGIAGSIGGARFYDPKGKELPTSYGGNIQGCFANLITLSAEVAVGGIAGEGSTNAETALISNSYVKDMTADTGVYQDEVLIKEGAVGGILGTDGNENNGHLIINTVSPADYDVIGSRSVSKYDDTVRLAPDYAFYQTNILSVLNKNTIHPDNPEEIYTGNFVFDADVFSDTSGSLAFPAEITELFAKTVLEETTNE